MASDTGGEAIAQERAFESELLETMLDVSGLLVVVLDEEGRIRRFNRACEELSGYSERELLGQPIWSILIPEDELPDVRQVHGRLLGSEEAKNDYANHWLTRSGEKRLIQWRNASMRDEAGRPLGYVGTGIDVSKRELALKAQWHWEHERHYLLDSLPLLIAHVDRDFRFRFANDGYRQWFGLEPDKLLGEHLLSVIGQAAFDTLEPHFSRALAGKRSVYHGNILYLHGPARFFHGTYIPNVEENGAIDGFYIVTVDLTEQERLREERNRARREAQAHLLELAHATRLSAMSEIATGLAHEISQPLSAIAASAEASLMRLDKHPEATASLKPVLEKIASQGQRARQIIEQLRNFLRKDLEDSRDDCDPAALVDHVLLLLESELYRADFLVAGLVDLSVILPDGQKITRLLQRDECIRASEQLRCDVVRCDGYGYDDPARTVLLERPDGRRHGRAGCQAVVDDEQGSAFQIREGSVTSIQSLAAFEFLLLPPNFGCQPRIADGKLIDQFRRQNLNAAAGNGPDRQFRLAGSAQFADHKHLERQFQGAGNLVSDGNAAARQTENKRIVASRKMLEPFGQSAPRVNSVREYHAG